MSLDIRREPAMVFRVYAGATGQITRGWHADCGSTPGTPMAVDIGANVGAPVRFAVHNDGGFPLQYRYRVDCTSFPSGAPSSVMVLVQCTAGEFLFRYTHIDVAGGIPPATANRAGPWSGATAVSPGRTRSLHLGTLCAVTAKSGISGWSNGDCGQSGGTSDVGGLCSSGPHLHQAASNGRLNGCLSANDSGQPGHLRGLAPRQGTFSQGNRVGRANIIFRE